MCAVCVCVVDRICICSILVINDRRISSFIVFCSLWKFKNIKLLLHWLHDVYWDDNMFHIFSNPTRHRDLGVQITRFIGSPHIYPHHYIFVFCLTIAIIAHTKSTGWWIAFTQMTSLYVSVLISLHMYQSVMVITYRLKPNSVYRRCIAGS